MSKAVIQATWDDVPHLSAKQKSDLMAALPPHQRDARSKGVPALGSGAIYPIPEEDFTFKPFAIPAYWPRSYALDVGWKRTAAVWGALDRETDTLYAYAEYYRGEAEPSIHATGVRAKGDWIPGVIDPAARGRSQIDGRKLVEMYKDLGLVLTNADNSVDAGIEMVKDRLSTGRLKVCTTLENLLSEYRVYRRNDKGAIVKENDHLMDALRYLVMSGRAVAITKPAAIKRKIGANTYT